MDGTLELQHNATGLVYFVAAVPDDLEGAHRAEIIRDERVDRIKIGFSRGIRQRMAGLRNGAAQPLELVAFLPGTLRDEAEWHVHFDEYRIRNEWFEPGPELRELILDIQACTSDSKLADVAVDHLTRARIRTTYAHGPEDHVREMQAWLDNEGIDAFC